MVIGTYSVIIQNTKTMESFLQFQPLFSDAVFSNRIGICKWNEAGTTIDSAVPELRGLTDDKKEWRAIIVRYADDNGMAVFHSTAENPYDFIVNADSKDIVEENKVPLVRLTQMLGGVPVPEIKFETEVIREQHKAPRTVYVPVSDPAQEQAYALLSQKYSFDGVRPRSIVIITIRPKDVMDRNEIGQTWETHRESDSSAFWKRNHYPSTCRFLTYDYLKQGPVQKKADDFNFWVSVFLLATNDIDPSMLQAYRLYQVKTHLGKDEMTESFQTVVDRLLTVKKIIEKEINSDIEASICKEETLPEYRLSVSVSFPLPEDSQRDISSTSFGLVSNGAAAEVALLESKKEAVEASYKKAVKSSERTLDRVADRIRIGCQVDRAEVPAMNRYQKEDLSQEINDIYEQIVSIQGEIPTGSISDDQGTSALEKTIRDELIQRVVRRPATSAFVVSIAALLLAMTPAILKSAWYDGADYRTLLLTFAAGAAVIGACALSVLLIQKMKLNGLLRDLNRRLRGMFDRLTNNAELYTAYMSSIASHERGSSFLALSSQKEVEEDEDRLMKLRHITAINGLLARIREWSKAHHLDVSFADKTPETMIAVDTSVNPVHVKLYTLTDGSIYPVAVNQSGLTIDSPFSFTNRIDIVREELYD